MAMKYNKVFVEAIGYELAPVVVTSTELEQRLEPLYSKLRIAPGNSKPGPASRNAAGGMSDIGSATARRKPCAERWRIPTSPRGFGRADLRRRVPRAFRAGDGVRRRRESRHQSRRRGVRRQQRLPGRPQRHGGHRQSYRAGPDSRRHGRQLRNGPRDRRIHDSTAASKISRWNR